MIFLRLAIRSLIARWLTVSLTILAIALSIALFLGVEKLRTGAKASFADTISGTDLIVGARSGGVQLLLYSVFRIGNATNNVTGESFEDIRAMPGVDWAVPLSLGDSHRGFRVLGTTTEYFDRYQYRAGRGLEFAKGAPFDDVFDAVLGADVAATLGYVLGEEIIVSHGVASFTHHDDKPFRVAGILKKTGTPVDRTVIVSLEGIEAIHIDWVGGGQSPARVSAEVARQMDLSPKAITAAMIGVDSKLRIFNLQRAINEYPEAAAGRPARRRPAGAVGGRRRSRNRFAWRVIDGGGHRPDRHGGDDLCRAERTPPRDGDPQIRRRGIGPDHDAADS